MGENKELVDSREWWKHRRKIFNVELIFAGFFAFLGYCIVGQYFIRGFESTIFTIAFQGIGYLVYMVIANILYTFGRIVEQEVNRSENETIRVVIYRIISAIAFFIPFIIPLYLFYYYGLK